MTARPLAHQPHAGLDLADAERLNAELVARVQLEAEEATALPVWFWPAAAALLLAVWLWSWADPWGFAAPAIFLGGLMPPPPRRTAWPRRLWRWMQLQVLYVRLWYADGDIEEAHAWWAYRPTRALEAQLDRMAARRDALRQRIAELERAR